MSRAKPGELMAFMQWAMSQDTLDCIVWPYACLTDGYPAITINRKSYRAIRVVCEEVYGPPGFGMQAAHSCRNPKCINKRHLRWATPKENSADQARHGTKVQGEMSPLAKISANAVLEIRSMTDRPNEIAARFGVSSQLVKSIRSGRTWKHLPLSPEARDAWRPKGNCIVSGCHRGAYARRMCASHYNAQNKIQRKEAYP